MRASTRLRPEQQRYPPIGNRRHAMCRSCIFVFLTLCILSSAHAAEGKLRFELINVTIAGSHAQLGAVSHLQESPDHVQLPIEIIVERTLESGTCAQAIDPSATPTHTGAAFHNVNLPMPEDLERPMLRTVATLSTTASLPELSLERGKRNTGTVNASVGVTGAPPQTDVTVEITLHRQVSVAITLAFSVSSADANHDSLLALLKDRGFDGDVHDMAGDALVVSIPAQLVMHKLPGGVLEVCGCGEPTCQARCNTHRRTSMAKCTTCVPLTCPAVPMKQLLAAMRS